MKTVMIIHRWSDGDPRCNKIIRTLLDESIKVIFVGIRTKESPVDETLNVYGEKYIRISFFQDSNSRKDVVFNLIPFIIFVLKNIAKFKPDIVHCVNEEIGLIACLLKKYFFKYMVLDLFDSLCLRIRTNNVVIKTMISYLCYFVYKSASDIIVTDEERKKLLPAIYRGKSSIIYNTPNILPKKNRLKNDSKTFKICVMGSIDTSKGIKQLISAIKGLPDVDIIAFGNLFDNYSKVEFLKNTKVTYLGMLNHIEAMRAAAETNLIFAFYEPISVNNIYASPNKLFEAMCLGVPILMNSEVKMSGIINKYNIGATCSYYDIDKIRKIIIDFSKMTMKEKVIIMEQGQFLFTKKYSWGRNKNKLLKIYENK